MTQMLVGVDDLPKLDEAEQERRRNASQRMQEKMTAWLMDNFEAKKRRDMTVYSAVKSRQLTGDFLLMLPHPDQDEEFARRAQILRSGTPQSIHIKDLIQTAKRVWQEVTNRDFHAVSQEYRAVPKIQSCKDGLFRPCSS